MKRSLLFASFAILLLSGCSVSKDYQSKITKDFTAIAGASGKLKNDSLFRKTTVTLSSYSEFVSLYNLQNPLKPIKKNYANSFGNYADVLDTLNVSVQNNTKGYEALYSKSMDYIMADVKDKYVNLCPKCDIKKYYPVLVNIRINVTDKSGKSLSGYNASMKPAISYKSNQLIKFNRSDNFKKGVVPGYYKFRVEKDGKLITERNEHIKNQTETVIIRFEI